jgi:hypothetical protein
MEARFIIIRPMHVECGPAMMARTRLIGFFPAQTNDSKWE